MEEIIIIFLSRFFLTDKEQITDNLRNTENQFQNDICTKIVKLCPIYEDKAKDVKVTAEGIEIIRQVHGDLILNKKLYASDRIEILKDLLLSLPALKCKLENNVNPLNDIPVSNILDNRNPINNIAPNRVPTLNNHFYFLAFMLKPSQLYPMFIFISEDPNKYYPNYKIDIRFHLE